MNSIRTKNIEAIEKNINSYPVDILNILEDNNKISDSDISIEVVDTKVNKTSKKQSAKIIKNNKTTLLHSIYDPEKEGNTLADEIVNDDLDLIFVIGIGAGFLVEAIFNKNKCKQVVAVEPNTSFFNLLINNLDISKTLSNKDILFFIGAHQEKDIEDFISLHPTKKVKVLCTRSYTTLFAKEVIEYQQFILSTIDKKTINNNTLSRFEKLWAYNISSNVLDIAFNYGVNKFYNKYKNIPAIVVSAGPSLEKNIELLKEAKKKAIIIAVDTVIKPLQNHGVIPHFILSIDPQKKNSKYFRGVDTRKSILIVESSIDNEVIKNHNGDTYNISSVFPLAQLFLYPLGDRGELSMGGSVSTAAFDFAIRLGANPVVMVGLDLSFPNHQTHIKGSYHEENFFTQIGKLDSYDSRIYNVLISGNLRKEKNVYGETIYTDSRFDMYKNWFIAHSKKNSNTKYLNATEGGVIIPTMENITLQSFLDSYKDIDINIPLNSSSCSEEEKIKIASSLQADIKKIDSEIYILKDDIMHAIELSYELKRDIERHRKVDKILKALEVLDKKLMVIASANAFISVTMQRTIKKLTEGFDLDEEAPKELKAAANSIKLYEAMLDSIEFNHYIMTRALTSIEKMLNSK